jgi:hypothetical protein
MVKPHKRTDWARPLPQPLQILDKNEKPIITLKTLGDVRKMPKSVHTWRIALLWLSII